MKSVIVLFFTASTLLPWAICQSVPSNVADVVQCPGNSLTTIPHPMDCTRYYVCILGRPVLNQCPRDYVFNPHVSFCVHQSIYRCPGVSTPEPEPSTPAPTEPPNKEPETTPAQPQCPVTPWEAHFCWNHVSDLIRNPVNCTQYINCEADPPSNRDCPADTVFSLPYQDCFPGDERSCQMAPLPSDFCGTRPAGSYAHPYQCNRFVTCFRGQAQLETCPPYYVFNPARLRCVAGDVLQCSSLLVGGRT